MTAARPVTLAEFAAAVPLMERTAAANGRQEASQALAPVPLLLACVPLLAARRKQPPTLIWSAPVDQVLPELAELLAQVSAPAELARIMAGAGPALEAAIQRLEAAAG